MPTYPLPSLAPSIDQNGITTLLYEDIYQSLIASFQAIYGSDIYIEPDSQDGQWLAVLAQGYYDCGQAMAAVFQAYSPTYAQGTGLSSLVKINGLQRDVATNSTATGNVVGVAGTIINNGVVADVNGNLWNLPPQVIIPLEGQIVETVTAQQPGSINAAAGTINIVNTPQLGWQSYTNTSNAALGAPVEDDAQLRVRQTISTSIAALGIKEALYSAVGNIAGVQRYTLYENATSSVDVNGVPPHSFDFVIEGGDATVICKTIAAQKPPGVQTFGSTSQTVYDQYGLPSVINFDVLTEVPIYYNVTINALVGYTSVVGQQAIQALMDMTNNLGIGEYVYTSQASAAASLAGAGAGNTFYIISFEMGTSHNFMSGNIPIAFNAAATSIRANINWTVT